MISNTKSTELERADSLEHLFKRTLESIILNDNDVDSRINAAIELNDWFGNTNRDESRELERFNQKSA